MSEASVWVCLAAGEAMGEVERVVRSLGGGRCVFATDADELRRKVLAADPGVCSVVVGRLPSGVSDVNVAAAVARDGNAHEVVLVRRGASGSLRSRAARAGIDRVVDPAEFGDGTVGGTTKAISGRATTMEDGAGELDEPDLEEDLSQAGGGPANAASGGPGARSWTNEVLSGQDHAPIITLCSGRGGVGKTTLVAAAAAVASAWGMRVSAVDLDLSCGNLFSCFGLPHASDLSRLADVGDVRDLDVEALGVVEDNGIRVWGPCERPEAAELVTEHVSEVLALAASCSDLVLVDTASTVTDAAAQAAQVSDRLVLVSDGRPGSIASLARVSGLAVRLGVARTRIARVENRADPRTRMDLSAGRAEVGLEAARMFRVLEGGPEVADLVGGGEVMDLVELGSAFTGSVATVLAQMLKELGRLPDGEASRAAAEPSTRKRGWLARRREAV